MLWISLWDNAISNSRIGQLRSRVIALCAILLAFDGYDIGAIGYVLPALARSWAKSPSDLTIAIVLSGVGMLIGAMIAGPLGDTRGRKPVLIASVLIFGIFSTASAFAATPLSLAILRFLTGLGLGGGIPAAIALTSDYASQENRPIVVGMMTCAVPVGLLLSGLTCSLLIPAHGWQAIFLVGGLLPVLILPLIVRLLPESPEILLKKRKSGSAEAILRKPGDNEPVPERAPAIPSQPKSRNLVGRLFTDGYAVRTLLLWIMFFCNFLATWLVIFWLPTILSAAGANDGDAAFISALLPAGGLAGIVGIALVVRHRRIELTLALALVLGAASILTMWAWHLPSFIAALVIGLMGMGLQGAQFGMNGLCGAVYPAAIRATGSGWAFGIGRIGNIIGPGLGGVILAMAFPARTMLLVAVISASVAALAMFFLDRERRAGRLET